MISGIPEPGCASKNPTSNERGLVNRYSDPAAFAKLRDQLYRTRWVVYAKPPFGGAEQVYDYLGRYTHWVRLANRRLLWRVRRKLIISYIFIGCVPAILIVAFFLLGGLLLFSNFSSYLVQNRLKNLADRASTLAQIADSMGWNLNTVKSRYVRALQQLRDCLGGERP